MTAYDVELADEPEGAAAGVLVQALQEIAAESGLGVPRQYRSAWRAAAARELVDDRMAER